MIRRRGFESIPTWPPTEPPDDYYGDDSDCDDDDDYEPDDDGGDGDAGADAYERGIDRRFE